MFKSHFKMECHIIQIGTHCAGLTCVYRLAICTMSMPWKSILKCIFLEQSLFTPEDFFKSFGITKTDIDQWCCVTTRITSLIPILDCRQLVEHKQSSNSKFELPRYAIEHDLLVLQDELMFDINNTRLADYFSMVNFDRFYSLFDVIKKEFPSTMRISVEEYFILLTHLEKNTLRRWTAMGTRVHMLHRRLGDLAFYSNDFITTQFIWNCSDQEWGHVMVYFDQMEKSLMRKYKATDFELDKLLEYTPTILDIDEGEI